MSWRFGYQAMLDGFHPKSLPIFWLEQRLLFCAPGHDGSAGCTGRAGPLGIDEAGHEGLPHGIAVLDGVAELNLADCMRALRPRGRR